MLPPKTWESAEVGIGRDHGATMLNGDRRVLGVGDQLPRGAGLPAQPLEYGQVLGARTDDTSRRPFHKRGNERERLVEGGRRVEDSGVGRNTDEGRQD